MDHNVYSEVTPDIVRLSSLAQNADVIDTELFTRYNVKRGLRDLNGKGVLAGLTNISDVRAKEIINGEEVPAHGQLFYRGYNVKILLPELMRTAISDLRNVPIFFCLAVFQRKTN